MASNITPQQRKEMEDFIAENPIDPAYDEEYEYLDGLIPPEQSLSRMFKKLLDRNPE